MRAEEQAQQAEAQITMFELLRSPTLRMPLTIAIMMQLSQQLSGINAVFYYSTNLFITTGLSETSAKYATIGQLGKPSQTDWQILVCVAKHYSGSP